MSAARTTAALLLVGLGLSLTGRVSAQAPGQPETSPDSSVRATDLAPPGTVVGTVFDSISGEPLPDAAVYLWETSYQAVTGPDGRFRIEDVPAGEYNVLFFHARLATLGVSPGPRPIRVEAEEETRVRLATPSMGTVVSTQCLMEDRPQHSGALAGQVIDAESELPLGGVSVRLSWHEEDEQLPSEMDVQTGPDGWYRTCAVPADQPVLVNATFYDRRAAAHEVSVAEDGFVQDELPLYHVGGSDVIGTLIDNTTQQPVEGVEAWLRGTHYRTLSDERGHFDFNDVPPGTYMLMTDHLVYGVKMDTLNVPANQNITVEMRLDDRPIEIAPLTVIAEAAPVTIDRRRGGRVITRSQIDQVRQQSRDAADVIRSLNVPGIVVRHNNSDGSICVGYSTAQVKMNRTGCVKMVVYINDVRATDPNAAAHIPPYAIERMVVYKPIEASNLFGLGAGNGVWMIYTRGN